jgi:hypothetical protein
MFCCPYLLSNGNSRDGFAQIIPGHLDGEEWIEVAILVGVAAGVRNHSGASAPEIH